MGKPKAIVTEGQKFGRLTVVNEVKNTTTGRKFNMVCDCGNTSIVFLSNLQSGHTSSCGCRAKEVTSALSSTHGMSKTREYKCWQEMLSRSTYNGHEYYEKYSKLEGGTEEIWKTSFEDFYAHIGPQPENKDVRWSVGRIDNDVGYIKGNVRWEDGYQQNRNRGKTKANTSGYTGVTWRPPYDRPFGRAIATWYELDGTQGQKSFSEKGIGKEAALELAAEHRAKMILKLNEQGAGYAVKHGK